MLATGLTKGSIYGNFENKDEVAIAVFHHNVDLLNKRLGEFLSNKKTFSEKLYGWTGYYRENWKKVFERGGCPVQNASVEADDNLIFLKEHVQARIRGWAKELTKLIEEGKSAGEFKKTINSEEYGYTIITLLEGGIMLGKIMNSKKLLFSALDRVDQMIKQEIKK
jgi:TetR/AcrR family transcriptional repressor of nem operon